MASDCPSPLPPSMLRGLATLHPSRHHHVQSLLGSSLYDTRTPHVLESHSERAALLTGQWVTTCSWLPTLCPCTAPLSCSLELLLNLSLLILGPSLIWYVPTACHRDSVQTKCTLAQPRKPDLWTCVSVLTFFSSAFAFLIEMDFSFEFLFAILLLAPHRFGITFMVVQFLGSRRNIKPFWYFAVSSVCNTVSLLILLKVCPVCTFLQQLVTKWLRVLYTYACSLRFSIDVTTSAPNDPCICWW